MNDFFYMYLDLHGRVYQTSYINANAHNGVAERKNRHLLEIAKALMFVMRVLKLYRVDQMLTTTYLIN